MPHSRSFAQLRLRAVFVLLVICLAGAVGTHGQVILDGPNVSGTVGLAGETFGSAYLTLSWNGGYVQVQLVNADTDFSIRVEPDRVLSATVSMNSFQNATNANVYHYLTNIPGPAVTATEPMQLNLSRPSGRIVGRVSVTGGSISRVTIQASKTVSSNEGYSGNATATGAPFDAILPFVAATAVSVSGTAVLKADKGCEVPVTLAARALDVLANGTVTPTWTFDLTNEPCNYGSIEGLVSFTGLGGANADAVPREHYVYASGPVSRNIRIDPTGLYVLSNLPPGSYYVYGYSYFNSPYGYFSWPGTSVTVGAGQLVRHDFVSSGSTLHGAIQPRGAWTLSDANTIYANFNTFGASNSFLGTSWDSADYATGNFDIVSPAGTVELNPWYAFFSKYDGTRSTWQTHWTYFGSGHSPLQAATTDGERHDFGRLEPETSESLVVVQPANSDVGLTTLRLTGNSVVHNDAGAYVEQRGIDLTSQAVGTAQNSVAVLVRGLPGTYKMTATGQGTDGATYSKLFDLVLGAPNNTPAGADVTTPITLVDPSTGASATGSITFGNVTTSGETTVSVSGSGPRAPGNFRVFGNGSFLYYDIQTSAVFDSQVGATVCLGYDDTGMRESQEQRLTLQHYACTDSETNTGCAWQDITSPGFPDTTNNKVCGVTPSFSIFALLQAMDDDEDGILDSEDNCPAVVNPAQSDIDDDGLGDGCDSDVDGDGIDDTNDNCRFTPNSSQENLDGDSDGNACDEDLDGDAIGNTVDNCPVNANPAQEDFDRDGSGDACDADDDSDGIADGTDICAGTPSGVLILTNGCSSAQNLELVCPQNGNYRNHGQYVSCTTHVAEEQHAAGLITEQEKDAIVASAATSDIGKR